MHSLKMRKTSKYEMTLKLDINKAYDCVEWSFLKHIMEKMGFHETWISWVMKCITSISCTFQING